MLGQQQRLHTGFACGLLLDNLSCVVWGLCVCVLIMGVCCVLEQRRSRNRRPHRVGLVDDVSRWRHDHGPPLASCRREESRSPVCRRARSFALPHALCEAVFPSASFSSAPVVLLAGGTKGDAPRDPLDAALGRLGRSGPPAACLCRRASSKDAPAHGLSLTPGLSVLRPSAAQRLHVYYGLLAPTTCCAQCSNAIHVSARPQPGFLRNIAERRRRKHVRTRRRHHK